MSSVLRSAISILGTSLSGSGSRSPGLESNVRSFAPTFGERNLIAYSPRSHKMMVDLHTSRAMRPFGSTGHWSSGSTRTAVLWRHRFRRRKASFLQSWVPGSVILMANATVNLHTRGANAGHETEGSSYNFELERTAPRLREGMRSVVVSSRLRQHCCRAAAQLKCSADMRW
jgi:hypothetical protein